MLVFFTNTFNNKPLDMWMASKDSIYFNNITMARDYISKLSNNISNYIFIILKKMIIYKRTVYIKIQNNKLEMQWQKKHIIPSPLLLLSAM